MTRPPYGALLVDFGGVLTTPIFDSFSAFCIEHEVDPGLLKTFLRSAFEATDDVSPVHLLETGQLDPVEWDRQLAEAVSVGRDAPIDHTNLKQRLFARIRPEPAMVMAVKRLRDAGAKTGLVSNSWGRDGYPRETFEDLFDAVVISGEVALRKPGPEIYLLAAAKVGVPPERCVFVDDFKVNVEGAEAVGMTGVLHKEVDRSLSILSELFDEDLQELAS